MTHGNDGSWALGGSTETFQSVARSRNKFRDTSSGMSLSPAASPLCSFARPPSLLAVASASRTGGRSGHETYIVERKKIVHSYEESSLPAKTKR